MTGDNGAGPPVYMPLRFAELVRTPPNLTAKVPDEERINLALRLGDFVRYENKLPNCWHDEIGKLDAQRHGTGGSRLFVIRADPPQAWSHWTPQTLSQRQNAWEEVATAVSRSKLLSKAVFIRLDLRDPKTSQSVSLSGRNDREAYQLRSGGIYDLNVGVYTANANALTEVTPSSSSDLVAVGLPFQSVVSGVAEHSSLLSCKRTVGDNVVALGISAKEPDPASGIVNTPNPYLRLRVSISTIELIAFVVLVFLGGFLASLDSGAIKEVCTSCGEGKFWGVAAKVLGSACLAGAAFVGFRKLPSA